MMTLLPNENTESAPDDNKMHQGFTQDLFVKES